MLRGLDRRITLERRTVNRDDYGEGVEEWTVLVERRPASYRALRGDERFTSEQLVARQQSEYRIRWSESVADLNPLDRLRDGDFIYDIIAVSMIGRREGWSIIATARAEQPEGSP